MEFCGYIIVRRGETRTITLEYIVEIGKCLVQNGLGRHDDGHAIGIIGTTGVHATDDLECGIRAVEGLDQIDRGAVGDKSGEKPKKDRQPPPALDDTPVNRGLLVCQGGIHAGKSTFA
jgi:hypothetical protein